MSGSDQTNQSDNLPKLSMEAATQLLSQAKAQIQAGQFADAQDLLKRLLTDYPNHSEALYF
ncbi:tetratricopeptide repeat protein, partial [Pseudomonadales bacterium]|nr:tetratricopeptide repeat protein [Pseudomonadales bacterium]